MALEAIDVGERDIDMLIKSLTVLCAVDLLSLEDFLVVDYLVGSHILHHFFLLLVHLLLMVGKTRS